MSPSEVLILWFPSEIPGNLCHWSIFIRSAESTTGTKHDVYFTFGQGWNYYLTEEYGENQSAGRLGGKSLLGLTTKSSSLALIIRRTPLPTGQEQSSQTWVWKVVVEAVKQRVLPMLALVEVG